MATELVAGAVLPPPASVPEFRSRSVHFKHEILLGVGIRNSGFFKLLWLVWVCDPVTLENRSNHANTKPKFTYPLQYIVLTTDIAIDINNYPYQW